MTHPTTTLSRATEREAGKEPERGWKNRYLCTMQGDYKCNICGFSWSCAPGDEWLGGHCQVYPSKAEAEAGANKRGEGDAYLGPIPVPSC